MLHASPDRWQRIETLFAEALEQPADERDRLLERACAGDPALRTSLDRLLRAHERADDFLQRFDTARAAALVDEGMAADAGESAAGRTIGPYRIVREAGRGGMGVVYLAERDDGQFRKQVALKVVPRGLEPDGHALRRFREERQILASLDHPHIARLLDGGLTEDGLPWFAMEYVEGTRIDRFCDARCLPLEQRLELFVRVCDAVRYAHGKLVVHRDLKPSNILVAEDGTPKLLDFGVAKLLAPEPGGEAPLTRTGVRPMTPEYASPEQIRGEPVTTASDVYSLGVLLYELLTGRSPHRRADVTPHELERRVLEEEPQRPSAAVLRASGGGADANRTPEQAGRARGATPERLYRRLRGDLDAIALAALAREPARRYASVEQLGADVRRHLAGLPVSARLDTPSYRARKFLRRHRVSMAVAAAFVLLLLSFSLMTMIQSARIQAHAEQVALERDRAEQVAGFLLELLGAPDPYAGRGGRTTVREVLDSGAVRIDRELMDQPELRAKMMSVMASAYFGLGLYVEARRLMEASLDVRRPVLGEEHPEVAASMLLLGQALYGEGDYRGAESLYRRSLEARRRLYGPDHPVVARSLNVLARALRQQGRYAEAESLLREALEIDRQHPGDEDTDLAATLRNLAHVLRDRGEYAAAEPLYREAYALHRQRFGDEHPAAANSLINLAVILHRQGDPAAAEPLFRQGLAVKQRLLGEEHEDVAADRGSYAALLHDLGEDAAAEAHYRRAIAVHRRVRPAGHPQTATGLLGLGELLLDRGDAVAAEPLLREALVIRQRALTAGDGGIGQAESSLGACLSARGRFAEAEPLLLRGYQTLQAARGDAHSATRVALEKLVAHYERAGRPDQAAAWSARR
jgi:eukaryotic-like serine/threonine-protein kinase